MSNVTELLQRVNPGGSEALFSVLYADLHRLASARLRRNETITLLNTTSLVHESYLRFLNARHLDFADRDKFFGYAASVMRSIIVDEIRQRRAEHRGGSAVHVKLDTARAMARPPVTSRCCASAKRSTPFRRSTGGWAKWSRCATSRA